MCQKTESKVSKEEPNEATYAAMEAALNEEGMSSLYDSAEQVINALEKEADA